ncbi:MAG: VWA domain-containing protein [Chitinophagaceae bacterium]|nr:MAG: VWA domain-containing protein [Chitinophagaceae bacterium]
MNKRLLIFFLFTALFSFKAFSNETTRILFILDASSSMSITWHDDKTRMDIAKEVLGNLIDSLEGKKNIELAFRVYGHQSQLGQRNCTDTRLEVRFSRNNAGQIKRKLADIRPRGTTPIAYTLSQAAGDFPSSDTRNIIILLTDGEETCGGNPCEVAQELEQKGVVLRHFAIGIGLTEEVMSSFECLGNHFNAQDGVRLQMILESIIRQITDETSAQVFIGNNVNRQSYTNLNFSIINHHTDEIITSLYHTLSENNIPDTLFIDPVINYNLLFHTIPAVYRSNISIEPGKNNQLTYNMPQGFLSFTISQPSISRTLEDKIRLVVYENENGNVLMNMRNKQNTRFLSDNYKTEILTLPIITRNSTNIETDKTLRVEIPSPGVLNLNKRHEYFGGIFVMKSGELEMIHELKRGNRNETLALQPGKYKIIYRTRLADTAYQTEYLNFNIKSGESLRLEL